MAARFFFVFYGRSVCSALGALVGVGSKEISQGSSCLEFGGGPSSKTRLWEYRVRGFEWHKLGPFLRNPRSEEGNRCVGPREPQNMFLLEHFLNFRIQGAESVAFQEASRTSPKDHFCGAKFLLWAVCLAIF